MDVTPNVDNKAKAAIWLPLWIVCIAQVGTSGDNAVVSMSTNEFIKILGASMDQVQLANIVYSLIAGALMVFGGMLGIAKGFKQVFMAGAALCTLGEMTSVIAPGMEVLIWLARSITGLGAALMIPSVLGIIVSLYEGKQRAIAFGGVGAATGVATIIMPISAGIILDTLGYQAAFATLSVWFFLVLLAAWKMIPEIKPARIRVDYIGTIMASIGLVAFIIGCSKISTWGLAEPMNAPFTLWGVSPALPLTLFGMLTIAITMRIEKHIEQKHGAALIPQSFIKTRQVRNGLYVTGLMFAIFGAAFFVAISWIMVVAGQGGILSGVAMGVMAIPMIIFSLGIPKKYAHVSPRFIILAATVANILGTLAMSLSLEPDGYSVVLMYIGLAFVGGGQGAYASQSAMIVSAALNPRDAAQSGGIQCSTRNVWQAAGVAMIGAVLLFSSTALFKSNIKTSQLPTAVKEYVAKTPVYGFMSNDALVTTLISSGVSNNDAQHALAIYKETRIQSAQYSFLALIVMILLHVPGFMGIPTKGWSEKQA